MPPHWDAAVDIVFDDVHYDYLSSMTRMDDKRGWSYIIEGIVAFP